MSKHGWVAAVVLAFCAGFGLESSELDAQQHARDPGVVFAVDVGTMFDVPDAFGNSGCTAERIGTVGGRVGYRATSWVVLEGGATLRQVLATGCPDTLPCPDSDPGSQACTSRTFPDRLGTDPFLSTSARVALEGPRVLGVVGVRVLGGVGWYWGKNVPVLSIGAGIRLLPDASPVRIIVDAERAWSHVDFTDVRRTYQGQELVGESSDSGSFWADPLQIRVGVEWGG